MGIPLPLVLFIIDTSFQYFYLVLYNNLLLFFPNKQTQYFKLNYVCLLNNRFQMTKIDDAFSESWDNIGVPQGTVLGPILFILHINDMLEIDLKKYKGVSYSYADDTVLLFSGKSWEDT